MATDHARDFDGTDDKIVFSSHGDLSGDALTISAWVNLDVATPTNDYVITMQDSGNTQYGIVMNVIATNRLLQLVRHGTTDYLWYSTSDISYGSWVHVLITSDGGLVSGSAVLYVNGSSVSQSFSNGSGSETAHTGSWVIGARSYDANRHWDGKISEVAVWNRVLTSGEISTLASTSPYYSATNIPNGLIFCEYPPNYKDIVNDETGTLTGTTLADGPDLNYLGLSTKAAYIKGRINTTSTKSAYVSGSVTGTSTSDSKPAYISGKERFRISWLALARPPNEQTGSTKSAYVLGGIGFKIRWLALSIPANTGISSTKSAYILGGSSFRISWLTLSVPYFGGTYASSKPAYIKGVLAASSSKHAYVLGLGTFTINTKSAYIKGRSSVSSSKHAYIFCGSMSNSHRDAYIKGRAIGVSTKHAFVFGYAGIAGEDVITLINSNGSLSAWFRVIAEGYGDGMLTRMEMVRRTVEGSIDHSIGDVYKIFEVVIKARHLETDIGYGDIEDIETFFGYNNPLGEPSDVITFIDHHGDLHTVKIIDSMEKSMIGVKVEGNTAWFLYKLVLQEIP